MYFDYLPYWLQYDHTLDILHYPALWTGLSNALAGTKKKPEEFTKPW